MFIYHYRDLVHEVPRDGEHCEGRLQWGPGGEGGPVSIRRLARWIRKDVRKGGKKKEANE